MLLNRSYCVLLVLAAPLSATSIPGSLVPNPPATALSLGSPVCNPATCDVLEGKLLNLPFIAVAGDVVLNDPDGTVSDVVRFFNNVLDTGGGTGLSSQVEIFSKVDAGPDISVGPDLGLPDPSTYSVNVVMIPEAPVGMPTVYNGNGILYSFYSDVPEPSTALYAAAGLLLSTACRLFRRRGRLP